MVEFSCHVYMASHLAANLEIRKVCTKVWTLLLLAVTIHNRLNKWYTKGSLAQCRCHWQKNFIRRRLVLTGTCSTPVSSAKLYLPNCDPIATC